MGLHQEDRPGHSYLHMELLGPVVDIHQEQIVQQKVLEEIVPVKPLLVCDDQVLQLAHRNLPHHVYILARPLRNQNIQQLALVHNLQQMMDPYHLAVRRRIREAADQVRGNLKLRGRGRHRCAR